MVGREDAAALARERIGPGRHGEPVEIGLYEFDLGYVAWPTGDLFVAAGIDEAIITLVRGDRHRSYPAG